MIGPRWPNQRRLESSPPSPPSFFSVVTTPLMPVAVHSQSSGMFPLQLVASSLISLSLAASLSSLLSLSISLTLSLSLTSMEHNHGRSVGSCVQATTRAGVRWPEHTTKIGSSSVDHGMAPFAEGRALGGRNSGVARMLALAKIDGGPWLEQVPFDPTIVMVPSVHDESGQILIHAFRDKFSKLWQGSWTKQGLIFR